MSRRVFVSVSGGVVYEVVVPPETDGTWTVIDWGNIEADPEREWRQFDKEDKDYIRKSCPDDHAKFFSQFNRKENANNAGNLD
jgi:protein gp37